MTPGALQRARELVRTATTLFFFTFLILLAGGHTFSAHAAAAKVIGARVAGDDERTRFVLDLDTQVKPEISGLAQPFRLIVDLPEVDFQLPDGAGTNGRGMVTTWRFGLFAPGKVPHCHGFERAGQRRQNLSFCRRLMISRQDLSSTW